MMCWDEVHNAVNISEALKKRNNVPEDVLSLRNFTDCIHNFELLPGSATSFYSQFTGEEEDLYKDLLE